MNDTALAKQDSSAALGLTRTARMVDVTITEAAAAHVAAWTEDQRIMAIHESAHVVVAAVQGLPVSSVSIKGQHGGLTESALGEDTQPRFRRDSAVRAQIVAALAGLMAERHFLGEATDGNEADVSNATNLCLKRLASGLDPSFPLVAIDSFGFGDRPQELLSQQVASVLAELQRAEQRAGELVAAHADQIIAFAARLFDRRRLDGEDLDASLRQVGIEPAARG